MATPVRVVRRLLVLPQRPQPPCKSIGFVGEARDGRGLKLMSIDPAYGMSGGTFIQSRSGKLLEARSSKTSYDAVVAAVLWRDSERLVGLT